MYLSAAGTMQSRPCARQPHYSRPNQPCAPNLSCRRFSTLVAGDRGRVWVRDPKAGENGGLQRFHALGFRLGLMIISDQVKEAVHCQVSEMSFKGSALALRFGCYGFVRERDVA